MKNPVGKTIGLFLFIAVIVLTLVSAASAQTSYTAIDLSAGYPGLSWAYTISDNGTIGGFYYTTEMHSVVMKPNGVPLASLADRGDKLSCINNAGEAVGQGSDRQGWERAVRWTAPTDPSLSST